MTDLTPFASGVVLEVRFLEWWFQFDPTTSMVRFRQDGAQGWSGWSRPLQMEARKLDIDIGMEIVPASEADDFGSRARKGNPNDG